MGSIQEWLGQTITTWQASLDWKIHMDVSRKRNTGRLAEQLACDYLLQKGLQLVARNYRCPRGEIDLIMQHGDKLVFIEVRYRRRSDYGSAAESVDYRKQQRITRCAQGFLQRNPMLTQYSGRFDVVCIAPGDDKPEVHWISDAFQVQQEVY